MGFCSNCGNPINDNILFCTNCGQRVDFVVKVQQQPFIQLNTQKETKPFKPNSGMGLAFITTLLCCPIIGIYAMVLADKVDTLYCSGHYREAEMKATDSKKWSIIGIVVGIIIDIVLIITLVVITIITDGKVFDEL